ncbi:hypothetical protein ACGTNG_10300 [Halomonas sp. 1390]|uniref:hypothetical protein n=1 Tax=Halomonas sp. B23F22_3 TaxID=3459516 RepID=UPI00373F86C8
MLPCGIFRDTFPSAGPDLAKLLFGSFVAGFTERRLPQMISKVTSRGSEVAEGDDAADR